jgi:tRNA 2-thiouridine synthesizing protein A
MSITPDQVLDARGLACPMPIIKTKKLVEAMQPGQVMQLISTDPGSVSDVEAWTGKTGNELLEKSTEGDAFVFFIKKA